MASRVVLYTGITSSSSYRVRICLALKKISYHAIWRDSTSPGPAKEVNALGQVPVLLIDDVQLTQSVAICEYLEETRPTGLLPKDDPVKRARVREIVEMVNSGIQPLQNSGFLSKIKDEKFKKELVQQVIHNGLTALEKLAEVHHSHDFMFDWTKKPTMAEIYLIPQVENAKRYGVNVEREFPRLHRITKHVLTNYAEFSATHPSQYEKSAKL